MINLQLLVALVSFKSPLATGRLPIFSPEFIVFTDPLLSVLGMYMFIKMNWIERNDRVNLGSVVEHS